MVALSGRMGRTGRMRPSRDYAQRGASRSHGSHNPIGVRPCDRRDQGQGWHSRSLPIRTRIGAIAAPAQTATERLVLGSVQSPSQWTRPA